MSADTAARAAVLVVPEPERGTLVVVGPDRATWLNGIVTCNLADLRPGGGAFGLLLNKTGKIVTDLWFVAGEGRLFVSTAPGTHRDLAVTLDRMLVMEDAELADVTDAHTWLSLHGPAAVVAASSAAARTGGAMGALDFTGLGGAALVIDKRREAEAIEALRAASPELKIAEADDWLRLRLERGVGAHGVDYGIDDNPHEAGLDQRAVSWTKGCYLGQEVVCMQGMRGKVKRRLVSLRVAGAEVPAAGTPVRLVRDGTEVGRVTSAASSPRLSAVVALARLHGPALDGAEALVVGDSAAEIVERPEP